MNLELDGDVAVVVGGARGIGRAMAEALAREGARIVLADRAAETPDVARQLAADTGRDALGVTCDVTRDADVDALVEQALARCGRVDHVLYAAGIGSGKFGFPFWNLAASDWPRVLDVNLVGAVRVATAFAPRLAEARRGTLLFVASVAGQIGSQTDPPYSAAKAALINFAQCAAKDLAPSGVRVNVVSPGMVQTELNRAVWAAWNERQPSEQRRGYDDWAGEKVRAMCPLGQWQEPLDVARAAVFLCSPWARHITGQTLNVDGGWVMHS